jgi:hypothetical protein
MSGRAVTIRTNPSYQQEWLTTHSRTLERSYGKEKVQVEAFRAQL